jgi:hypothetical protein
MPVRLAERVALKKYLERLVVVLPRPMKAALLQLAQKDGRRLGEFIRSLIGDALKDDRRKSDIPQHHP